MTKRFKKPTPAEAKRYATEIGYHSFDGCEFCDFYESKGWVVGKSPMKDWKAAIRTWARRNRIELKRREPPKVEPLGPDVVVATPEQVAAIKAKSKVLAEKKRIPLDDETFEQKKQRKKQALLKGAKP